MRALEPENRVRVGIMALVLVLLVTGVGQSFTSVPMIFAQARDYGEFGDSGALRAGDKVRIAGMDVGTVQELGLATGHVVVRFTLDGNTIGTQSRLSIRTDTILGKKVLEVEPRGDQPLQPGGTVPLSQTTTPYQIYDAFRDATKDAAGWDVGTIKQSLQVLTDTVDQTAPHLSAALDGVQRFADTVSKRDDQIHICWARPARWPACSAFTASRSTGCWSTPRHCCRRSTPAARPSKPCSATSSRSPPRSKV